MIDLRIENAKITKFWFGSVVPLHLKLKTSLSVLALQRMFEIFLLLDTPTKEMLLGTSYFVILLTFNNSLNNPSMISCLKYLSGIRWLLNEPVWDCTCHVEKFVVYKDGIQVYQFLIAPNVEFEAVLASLVHRDPSPSFEKEILKVLFEELD